MVNEAQSEKEMSEMALSNEEPQVCQERDNAASTINGCTGNVDSDLDDSRELYMEIISNIHYPDLLFLQLKYGNTLLAMKKIRRDSLDKEKKFIYDLELFDFWDFEGEKNCEPYDSVSIPKQLAISFWKTGLQSKNNDPSKAKVMSTKHPRYCEFLYRLIIALDFKFEDDLWIKSWKCNHTFDTARQVVEEDMGEIFEEEVFSPRDSCECTILLNTVLFRLLLYSRSK